MNGEIPNENQDEFPKPGEIIVEKKAVNPGIGMPAAILLHDFGLVVRNAFGGMAYHVGSSLYGKQWRDVDVRLILEDDVYEAMEFGNPAHPQHNAKWCAMCLAFATLGKQMTGLPIDFQIQQQSYANSMFPESRSALVLAEVRLR